MKAEEKTAFCRKRRRKGLKNVIMIAAGIIFILAGTNMPTDDDMKKWQT